jgi:NAD(P)H dehydrogenase (quinone)
MKNILVIMGHPDKNSFCNALAEKYIKGASENEVRIEQICIADLNFNPNLAFGYNKRMELEPDLLKSWEKIKRADHLVFVYPIWWGGMPAMMKGFIDRLFLPGFVFKKRENSVWWDKYLVGKSARIISTMDQPAWYFWLIYWAPAHRALKNTILKFCGVSPVKITSIGPIRLSSPKFRENKLKLVYELGKKLK